MNVFSSILVTFALIFILVGTFEYFFPTKNIKQKGYRTKKSLRNQESWDFAQKYYAKLIVLFAFILLPISFIGSYFPLNNSIGFCLSVLLILLIGIIIRYKTEKALKKKFE